MSKKKIVPKGVVVKSKGRPASKGPIKATIDVSKINGEPGGFHLNKTRNF